MFYIVFEFKELFICLQPDVLIEMGFGLNCSILNGQMILKNQN